MIRSFLETAGALAAGAPRFFPARASSVAGEVDRVFGFIFWLSVFFFVLIVALTILFVVRYRRRPGRLEPEASPSHSTRLELFWTGVPLVLVAVLFVWSTRTWVQMTRAPEGAGKPLQVQVTGRRWSWWFDHPGGKGAPELHLVANRPAELTLAATDVIHSLYVPEFRLKQDAVPGRFTRMVFTPSAAGTYPILCTEYCGTDHSRMLSAVVVHPDQASFDAWAREGLAPDGSLVALGKQIFGKRGCAGCHSLDGTRRVGPSLKGLFGSARKLADGSSVTADQEYLRESLVAPGARLAAGFPNVMPPVALEERDLQALAAYLQSLSETP